VPPNLYRRRPAGAFEVGWFPTADDDGEKNGRTRVPSKLRARRIVTLAQALRCSG
jgi:hypothetical protein